MSDIVERARHFAVQAHKRIDHTRKYTNQSYDLHLQAVAEGVASVTDDSAMIAAAWLHDVVEDTPATFEDLSREFGRDIARLVLELTDISKPGDGNRAMRKAIDRAHIAAASDRAKTIKLADLIDNCRDICRHDARFAKVYLGEMRGLLAVLQTGDAGLYARAERELERCARRLGLDHSSVKHPILGEGAATGAGARQSRGLRLFVEAFTAKDIAEPLRSFDADADALQVAEVLDEAGLRVAAVRERGLVTGLVDVDALTGGRCAEHARPLGPGQVLSADAPLSQVVWALTRYQTCLLSLVGGVEAAVTRADIQKPVARMWLFGILTLIEMDLATRIRNRWPDGGWHALISHNRLGKADVLMNERRRRGQACDLVDCLQLSDKAQILMRDPDQLAEFGFASISAAKQVAKELESLRNNLAHGQDIVTHDWAQIARMARRIESLLTAAEAID